MEKKNIKKDFLIKIGLIIAILVVINVISSRVFTRIDLTKNRSYTLSPISKELVGQLNDKLVIKCYFSENLPPPYNSLRKQVQDMLSDYRSYSHGNLNYEFFNPTAEDENNELVKEAQKFGIQPVQLSVQESYKSEVKMVFLGMAFLYGGKQEVLPFVQSVDNLEYDITSTIKKLITEKKKRIGFLTGHNEYDHTKFNEMNKILSPQYDLVKVDVSRYTPVPSDIDVLIVMGPRSDFPESHKFMLDQYIMRGGNIAWLINKVVPNFQQNLVIGDQVQTNLDDLLANYGIVIENNCIRDLQAAQIQRQTPFGFYALSDYYFFPKVTRINRDIPAFKNIPFVVLAFVSSLDLNAAASKGVTATPLLTTSDKSGKVEGFFFLDPQQFDKMTKKQADTLFASKGFVVGAIYTGKFNSFYAGKEVPADTNKDVSPYTGPKLDQATKESKMIVIGDGDFMNEEQKVGMENIVFFTNIVEYLADDVGLSQIKGKQASEPAIEYVSDTGKRMFTYLSYIVPVGIVVLFGVYNWNKKKQKRKRLQNT